MNRITKEKYRKNVWLNYLFQGAALVLALVLVRVSLAYLGKTLYGVWTAMASLISLLSLGNLGIGHGLRNELSKAVAQEDSKKINDLLNTGIRALCSVAAVIFLLVVLALWLAARMGWVEQAVVFPLFISGALFCINLVPGIASSVAYAYQQSFLVSVTGALCYLLQILFVAVLTLGGIHADLRVYALITGLAPILGNAALWLVLQRRSKGLFHLTKEIRWEYLHGIMNLGISFFLLQVCDAVLFSTDSIIIKALFDSDTVTEYFLINKVYDAGNTLFNISLISLWSGVTYAAQRGDFAWIHRQIRHLLLLLLPFCGGVAVVALLTNPLVQLWAGDPTIVYSAALIALFAISCAAKAWNGIFVHVANGLSLTQAQLCIWLVSAIANIPLSIFFGKTCGMGVFGVKLASSLAVFVSGIFMPFFVARHIGRSPSSANQ